MAEDERWWRARHAHESHGLGYGNVGTATFDEIAREWRFLRNHGVASPTEQRNVLKIVSEPEQIVKPPIQISNQPPKPLSGLAFKHYPELAPAWLLIEDFTKEARLEHGQTEPQRVQTLALGHALYLDLDGQIQDVEPLPVMAFVSGTACDTVQITSLGRETIGLKTVDHGSTQYEVPSLSGTLEVKYISSTPVLQISFSEHNPSYLAVRTAFATTLFQLFVSIDNALQLYRMLSIPSSHTGGPTQADFSFSPTNQRLVAIVDSQGNFSTWTIHGRRSRTTRILHQARLQIDGKIFSFSDKKRPGNTGLYFDGWHRILFCSHTGQEIDRIWVSNRQNVNLFDLQGNVSCNVDVRLDTRKVGMYILDVKTGCKPHVVIVLTTVRVLVFDLAQKEWRDGRSTGSGPLLLCSWEHQQALTAGLKLSHISDGNGTVMILYGGMKNSIIVSPFDLIDHQGFTFAEGTALRTQLVCWSTESPVTQLVVVRTQAKHQTGVEGEKGLIRVIAHHEDLSMSTFLARNLVLSATSSSLEPGQFVLRFPPVRGPTKKSSKYIDQEEEDDLDNFVALDDLVDVPRDTAEPQLTPSSTNLPKPKHTDLSRIAKKLAISLDMHDKSSIDLLSMQLEHMVLRQNEQQDQFRATTLDKIIDSSRYQLNDIHSESSILDRAITNLESDLSSQLNISKHGSQSLQDIYQTLFDTFVAPLSPAIPDRSRLHRERLIRPIALDLYFSSLVIRPHPQYQYQSVHSETSKVAQLQLDSQTSTLRNSSSQQLPISSSPPPPQDSSPTTTSHFPATQPTALPHEMISSPRLPPVLPATQPTHQVPSNQTSSTRTTDPNVSSSSLTSALARLRLRTLTTLSSTPTQTALDTHVSSLLNHLPPTITTSPSTYDWRTLELETSMTQHAHDTNLTTAQARKRALKAAAKAARAAERTERLKRQIALDQAHLMPVVASAASTNQLVPDSTRFRTLPVRPQLTTTMAANVGLSQAQRILSDSGIPQLASSQSTQSQSQTQVGGAPPFSMTQPTAGAFGTRAAVVEKPRVKVKTTKKRKAGF